MDGVVKRRHREYTSLYSLHTVHHHAFDLTRDVACTPAWPAAIVGAASTFFLSFRFVSSAHLETQSALDTGEHIHSRTQSTFHSNHGVRYGQLTSKLRDLKLKHHLGTWLPIHHSRRPHNYTVLLGFCTFPFNQCR